MDTQITIETDESGFWLRIETEHRISRFRITDPEQLYDRVKGAIGPWLRERDEAQIARAGGIAAFVCNPDESAGAYELRDPKHPDHHSVHADIWDAREGK